MKRWYRRLMWLLGILVFVAAFAWWQWQRQLHAWGISDWHMANVDLSLSGLGFDTLRVSGQYQGREYQLQLHGGSVVWRWRSWRPKLEQVSLADMSLSFVSAPAFGQDPEAQASDDFPLPEDWQLPAFLPHQVNIERLQLLLPCESGGCGPDVSLHLLLTPTAARVQMVLLDAPEPLRLGVDYQVVDGLPRLQAQVSAARFLRMGADLALEELASGRQWRAELDVHLERPDDQWQAYLRRWHPALDIGGLDGLNAALGLTLDRLHLSVKSTLGDKPLSAESLAGLPMQLRFETWGNLRVQLEGGLLLNSKSLAFSLHQAKLTAAADSWAPSADLRLAQLTVDQSFDANWSAGQLHYQLLAPAEIKLARADGDGWALNEARLQLENLTLAGPLEDWRQMQVQGRAQVSLGGLEHVDLHPQFWRWQGGVMAAGGKWQLEGELVAGEGINIPQKLDWEEDRLVLTANMGDVFILAGNSLQQLTPHWPPLLTLSRGRLGASAELRWQLPEPVPQGEFRVRMSDLAGFYDTTAFSGASGDLLVTLDAKQFQIASENLRLQQLIQGFTLGPLQAVGSYSASFENPAQGQLVLARVESEFLQGRVQLVPGTLDMASLPQQLVVEVHEIDLAQLLAEHPSSDITGSGRISGRLPLTLGANGIAVEQGRLAALEPGGQLQYRSPRAAAMAASNPSMKVITDALDDFHYSVLSSEVSYDESGKLLLAVRLQGSNPAIEGGRAINFNINLEEDLPAMIASLQLSSQISDQIKKRVQEKLRRQQQ